MLTKIGFCSDYILCADIKGLKEETNINNPDGLIENHIEEI